MLTAMQVVNRLAISERLVRRWIADDELTAYRAGRVVRVRESDAGLMLVLYSPARAESA